jgi:hypothetical protein
MICFQVLTGCEVEWVPASGGNVPDKALPSGETEEGEPLFVGRVSHEGTLTLGKVYCYWRLLYVQLLDFTLNGELKLYRVIQEERPVFWESIVRREVHVNMCRVLNVYCDNSCVTVQIQNYGEC